MQHFIKRFLDQNFKSSPKFGRLAVSSNNFREIFRERRFLYFTKKGPIEIVFNLKHYISAFVLSVIAVLMLLNRLNRMKLFEGTIGLSSARDAIDIIDNKK